MNISQNFTLEELLRSETASRKNVSEQWTPSDAVKDNLKKLCDNVLEPLRSFVGKPLIITSGYRCKRVNKLVGGSPTSQHTEGKAADFHVSGMTVESLFKFIINLDLEFDQIIQEFDAWVHISFNAGKNRNEILRATKKGGKTVYNKVFKD
jgi:hypothetical protein